MSEWRPEGWENPYPDINAGFPTNDFIYSEYDLFDAHEAGADAILAALKTRRVETRPKRARIASKDGTVVFIPDKE